ncbi:MAG TPA: preprotein translocase subunit TatC [Thermodesulfatator sp.]|nr:preprotein translocase subunit TatC [Thermodesulfatator sp.]
MRSPDPSLYHRTLIFLFELRKAILLMAGLFVATVIGLYFYSPILLRHLQHHLHQKLAFFGIAEPFLAMLKLSVASAVFILMPLILLRIWLALAATFHLSRLFGLIFVLVATALFYAGAAFCYFVTLPFGIKFLLSYGSGRIEPVISVGKFVSFVGLFIIAFGLIFELPLIMILLARLGLVRPQTMARYRRHAILIISILAAVLTPTPDVINMSLMALPLYFLFEAGLLLSRPFARKVA